MIKKLYHGSNHIIEHPEFGAGKRYNDYGRGFYCTEQLDMAKEWAVGVGEDGYANCYELDTEGLQILNLNGQGYTILHWLSVLLQNRQVDVPSVLAKDAKEYLIRNFNVDYMNYDVIVGYRADDSYFSFAQDFLNGTISYRQCYSNLNHTSAAHTTPPVTGVLPLCTRLRRVRRNNPPWRSL